MSRAVFSLAILVCLGLAILQLVSAEQQNRKLEAVSNQAVQAKPEEVQVKFLREADDKRTKRKRSKLRKGRGGKGERKSKRKKRKNTKKGTKIKRKQRKTVKKIKKSKRKKGKNKKKGTKIKRKQRKTVKKIRKSKRKPRKTVKKIKKSKRKQRKNVKKRRKSKWKQRKNVKKNRKTKRKQKKNKSKGKEREQNNDKGNKKIPKTRQGACNVTDLCQKTKSYIKYSNQLRKLKRIIKTCSTMAKKAAKAEQGEFNATHEGLTCNVDKNVTKISEGLKNCTASAKAYCDTTAIDGCIDTAGNKKCQQELENWISKFGPAKGSCLQGLTDCCACINGISPDPSPECLSFDAIDKASNAKKKNCTGSDTKGSFGYCRKLQMSVAEKGVKAEKMCCNGTMGGTTACATVRRRMVFRKSLVKKWDTGLVVPLVLSKKPVKLGDG